MIRTLNEQEARRTVGGDYRCIAEDGGTYYTKNSPHRNGCVDTKTGKTVYGISYQAPRASATATKGS